LLSPSASASTLPAYESRAALNLRLSLGGVGGELAGTTS
jgi:hypothetical protein